MKIVYSESEMLKVWKLCQGLEPLRNDGNVVRTDGIDLDRLMKLRMRSWYLELLDTAPKALLAPEDISHRATLTPQPGGALLLTLPSDCRRVVEVKLEGWERPAAILGPDDAEALRRQRSPYTRGGAVAPVAEETPEGLLLYGAPEGTEAAIETLLAIVDPGPGSYVMDDSALRLVPCHPLLEDLP